MSNQIRLLIVVLITPLLFAANVAVERHGQQIDIAVGGKAFTTFFVGEAAAKAYLMPLRTAQGLTISRPFPVGNDVSGGDPKASSFEPHQRPLYFAHGNINGLNFWGESAFDRYYSDHSQQAYGHLANPKIEETRSGAASGSVKASFSLADPNGRIVGRQTEEFVFSGDDRQRVIDCTFVLWATNGPLTLGDTKEGTFGIRLGPELSAPLGRMLNSQGGEGEKNIWGKPANWVLYSGQISGHKVGVVVFDHPASFHHPTTWHARSYGLLAANPFGLREFTNDPAKDGSWTIPEGKSLAFKYRVLIYDGEMSRAEVEAAYSRYAEQR
jgi:hypothetical protein